MRRPNPFTDFSSPLEARLLFASWYVDNGTGGTGVVGTYVTSTGTAITSPFKTINYAAQHAAAGDTVFVRAGTYREEVHPLKDGTVGLQITYIPYNGETVSVRRTDAVSTQWTQLPGTNTYSTAWPGLYASAVNNSDQVFANDEALNLARWPDQDNSDLSHPNQARVDSIVSSVATGQRAWIGGYEINRITFVDAAAPAM